MPYYCTVPRCTSMAGKAKNVSFHQFPKNEELADLWNNILKRGKPYTKYSKVCSLHFKPEDYTITSVGKNKGQWRSLRKDAVPSQNLPNEAPSPHQSHHRRSSTPSAAAVSSLPLPPNLMDPKVQQQVAQAIYMQTMLAMQAAAFSERDQQQSVDLSMKHNGTQDYVIGASDSNDESDSEDPVSTTEENPIPTTDMSELQRFLFKYSTNTAQSNHQSTVQPTSTIQDTRIHNLPSNSYKCTACSKFFKDPDVFLIHQRSHRQENISSDVQKENIVANRDSTKTLLANPILANLLRPDDANRVTETNNSLDKIKTAMALNMDAYIKNITCCNQDSDTDSEISLNESKSPTLVIDESVQKNWRL